MMAAARQDLWVRSIGFVIAVVLVGFALQISNGHLNGVALLVLTFALSAVAAGIAAPVLPAFEERGRPIVFATAGAGLALQLGWMFEKAPGIYLKLPDAKLYFVYLGGIVAAGAVVALAALGIRPHVWLPLLVAVHFTLGVWMIRMSPAPRIDVFYNQTAAAGAILHGRNPYTATYPDIYASPPAQITPAKTYGYPPVSYLLAIPGYLAGDIRYAHLAAMSLTALLIGLARPTQLTALIGALFLFTPRTFFVLEQAWTEPFVLLLLAAVLFCKIRGHSKLFPLFLGLLIGSKQHMFLIVPAVGLLTDEKRSRWKRYVGLVAKSTAVAVAITLPFALWNPEAFWHVVSNFSTMPVRSDSLSYPAWLSLHDGPFIPPAVDLFIAMLALGVSLWRLPRTSSGFAAASATMYFALFLFSLGSFCNYYYLVLGMLAMAVAFSEAGEMRRGR